MQFEWLEANNEQQADVRLQFEETELLTVTAACARMLIHAATNAHEQLAYREANFYATYLAISRRVQSRIFFLNTVQVEMLGSALKHFGDIADTSELDMLPEAHKMAEDIDLECEVYRALTTLPDYIPDNL